VLRCTHSRSCGPGWLAGWLAGWSHRYIIQAPDASGFSFFFSAGNTHAALSVGRCAGVRWRGGGGGRRKLRSHKPSLGAEDSSGKCSAYTRTDIQSRVLPGAVERASPTGYQAYMDGSGGGVCGVQPHRGPDVDACTPNHAASWMLQRSAWKDVRMERSTAVLVSVAAWLLPLEVRGWLRGWTVDGIERERKVHR